MSHLGSSRHQVTPIFRDVPGLSWDVPCGGILQTPNDHSLDIPLCLESPGTRRTPVGNTGHPSLYYTPKEVSAALLALCPVLLTALIA